ncbi:5'-nucleotidase C-terminal domain-containing protein, partial [Salmonella enterica]|nr:5'-nucleotidase C-terminal domain-containing protein [Salmonella enterica]
DPSAPDGARITEVTLHGNILAPTAQVTVAANPLLAGGGDHFFTMAAGTRPRDSGRIDTQAMVDWFTEYGVVSPDLAKRSVGV